MELLCDKQNREVSEFTAFAVVYFADELLDFEVHSNVSNPATSRYLPPHRFAQTCWCCIRLE